VVGPDPSAVGPVEDTGRGVVGGEPLDQAAVGRDGEGPLGGPDVGGEDIVLGIDRTPGEGRLAVVDAVGVGGRVLPGQARRHPVRAGDVERLPGEVAVDVVHLLAVGRLFERVGRRPTGIVLALVGRVGPAHPPSGAVAEQADLAVQVPRGHHLPLAVVGRLVVVDLLVLVPVDEVAAVGGAEPRGRRPRAGRHTAGRDAGHQGHDRKDGEGGEDAPPRNRPTGPTGSATRDGPRGRSHWGVTLFELAEAGPEPSAFSAATVKE
jgi:hypothetical protein